VRERAAAALDEDWPGVLEACSRLCGPESVTGKPSERARAAIGYVQLVYGRQLQQPADEQPADVDPLDIASMTREQRDKLKRTLIARHQHLVDELGLDMG
jgi:hypothetical protein